MPRLPVLALALLAACASEAPDAPPGPPPPTTSAPSAPAEAPADTASPASPSGDWTVGIVDLPASGDGQAVLTGLRTARHDGYDRLVFEFEDARPAVHLEYVDRPVRACGSGHVVELPGDGWLQVRFSGARAHTEAGEVTVDPATREFSFPTVLELARTCDFEGEAEWVAAVAAPTPFRVTTLAAPPRVAVDVRHE